MTKLFLILAIITSLAFIPKSVRTSAQQTHKSFVVQDSTKIFEDKFKYNCKRFDSSLKETVINTKKLQKRTFDIKHL